MNNIKNEYVEFKDNDDGYFEWLKENLNGYVLNTERNPKERYMILHKSTCYTISRYQKAHFSFTKDYIKFCSNNLDNLKTLSNNRLQFCKICCKQLI